MSHSHGSQVVPWCTEVLSNPNRFAEIYTTLAKREGERVVNQKKSQNSAYQVESASTTDNKHKNRYCNILPYDSCRVHLPKSICRSDYINANWIKEPGFDPSVQLQDNPDGDEHSPRRWIASQGPTRETRYEFLSLFLHPDPASRPRTIIQLTACQEGHREKSAPYVPDKIGETIQFSACYPFPRQNAEEDERPRWKTVDSHNDPDGLTYPPISVTLEESVLGPSYLEKGITHATKSNSKSFYKKNVLTIALGRGIADVNSPGSGPPLLPKCRVTHFECVDWPDHGTPEEVDPIIELINAAQFESLQSIQASTTSTAQSVQPQLVPLLVHCSAGVGRTGTLIAIASCMRRINLLRQSCPGFGALTPQQKTAKLSDQSQLGQVGLSGVRLPSLPSSLAHDLIARTVDHLREQRVCMVQTDSQLAYVYKAVASILRSAMYPM